MESQVGTLAQPHSTTDAIEFIYQIHGEISLYWGLKPSALHIDNELPEALNLFFKANILDFQLCPHHTNQAEKSIYTWKCHFLAGLSGVDPNFPLHIWCRLLPQATQTLKLLHISWIKPRLSAVAQLNRAFDYNRTPMASPGTKVHIHDYLGNRHTWDFHGKSGWYIGKTTLHYRCY